MADRGRGPDYIVCGANTLAHRLVAELTELYEVSVVAIVPNRERDHAPQITKLLGRDSVIAVPTITEEVLKSADVATARGIALVDGDDQSNIHAALRAQALNPQIRVVLRMYNQRLGKHVERLLNNCAALSRSATAAPAFVNAALRRPNSVQVGGKSVSVEIGVDGEPADFLCTIADRIDKQDLTQMRLLPDAPGPAATWISGVTREPPIPIAGFTTPAISPDLSPAPITDAADPADSPLVPGTRAVLRFLDGVRPHTPSWFSRLRWRLVDLRRLLGATQLSRVFLGAFIAVLASFFTVWYLNQRFAWAVYDTLLDMAGAAQPDVFGQPSQTGGSWQRVAQVVSTFCGIMFIPAITAIMLDVIARGRAGIARQPSAGVRGHVVVFGLGNVGVRVATLIHQIGIPVVCIERDPTARGIAAVRGMELPVLTGEAPLEDQLRKARVHRCRAVLALTGDDAANLEAALEARALAPDVRVVLRLFDDDFATQVYRTFTNAASRSVSYLAAPAFAAALMGREVLGTLSVYRHVVLVAEFVADEESGLVGRTLHNIEVPGEVRVIAVRTRHARDYQWRPDHARRLEAGDTYVLLATRAGLGRHTSRVS
ncbi:NAD-binding protein [Actinocrinis sp.]|uniref:NAD-binding protein n=1 Tax=Actinocrinis sp. TaxID=1920516 RepID=UPI002D2ED6F1|nr:NAD-binding protein [Actinocrinis sp.]HZP51580.1 NAD-binding protein [Actinocrinis sp.]